MQESHDAPMSEHTTMRVGGPAQRLVVAETIDEVVDAVREVDDAQEPLLVLGGGSNLVVSDAGFAGTVVKVATSEDPGPLFLPRRGPGLLGPIELWLASPVLRTP